MDEHVYLTPAPALVRDGLHPDECGECGLIHIGFAPGDLIPATEEVPC